MSNLKNDIIKHNTLYRLGIPKISDQEYDRMVELYKETYGQKLDLIEYHAYGNRIKLPFEMGSLVKVKTIEEIKKWLNGYNRLLYVSPKLDGISLEVGVGHAMSKNDDGINGTLVTNQFMYVSNANDYLGADDFYRGEVVISWDNFFEFFEPLGYAHPRNAVAGLFNSKNPDKELLKHVEFIPFKKCSNEKWVSSIITGIESAEELTHDLLYKLYKYHTTKYPCDGMVIQVINSEQHFGYETNSLDPKDMRAYKHKSFDDVHESEVLEVIRQISKDGVYNPVLKIKPTTIGGAEIRRINVDNELFIKIFGVGTGTKIGLKKSGGIIPRLVSINGIEIPERKELLKISKSKTINEVRQYYHFPNTFYDNYIEPSFDYEWSGVSIKRVGNDENRNISIKIIEHFLTTTRCKGIGISTLEHLYDNHNVTSIKELISFNFNDIIDDDGYGKIMADNCKIAITKSLSNIEEHVLMAASGLFPKLGTNKLRLYVTGGLDSVGLGEYAIETIKNGLGEYTKLYEHVLLLGYKIKNPNDENYSGNLYCPTNCRINDKLLMILRENGHNVTDSWNSKVTHVVRVNETITSNKTQKAVEKNIPIITLKELMEEFLTTNKIEENINESLW